MKIVYVGSLPAVVVDVAGRPTEAKRGEPIEVPDWFAENICQQRVWNVYEEPKPAAPKRAAKTDDEVSDG